MRLLVTRGVGYIGHNVLRFLANKYLDYTIVCADKFTYATDYELVADLEQLSSCNFEKLDIIDKSSVEEFFQKYVFIQLHSAAKSHVDNLIDPLAFAKLNVLRALNFNENQDCKFYHISTNYVRVLESRWGMNVGGIEEVTLTSGFVSLDQAASRAEKLSSTSYRDNMNHIVQSNGG